MYPWVSEGSIRKYHRAVAVLTKENSDRVKLGQEPVAITEEAVKKLYIEYAGLVLGEVESVVGTAPGDEEAALARAEEVQPEKAEKLRRKVK